ncbi:winged helix-turn-helix domain-containing protein [Pseudomonas sp. CM27]|uniref:winged helix-turn-helix domain-containing protein n=1 Tax=Pseudomonas sp. CM27 TaxID=2738452 RepID=UPI0015522A4F|nr:winged helix-turn-helix domain-containing protein [Pseudomonas sp. CM27]NQD75517.1 winged helix-turn-helix transcriptional regulator [Pseudomonas sp. CM27]
MSHSQSAATNTFEQLELTASCGTVMSLCIQQNVVRLHDHHFQLKPTPSRLLALLIRHGEQVVNRQTVLTEVWGYDFDPGTKIIDVQICYLRKALAAVHAPFEIKTHRGRGISLRSLGNVNVGNRSR